MLKHNCPKQFQENTFEKKWKIQNCRRINGNVCWPNTMAANKQNLPRQLSLPTNCCRPKFTPQHCQYFISMSKRNFIHTQFSNTTFFSISWTQFNCHSSQCCFLKFFISSYQYRVKKHSTNVRVRNWRSTDRNSKSQIHWDIQKGKKKKWITEHKFEQDI